MTSDEAGGPSPVRVVIIDDQHLVRQGIQALLALSSHVTVVAEADDGQTGLAAIEEHHPEVVLLDLRMPRMSRFRPSADPRATGIVPRAFMNEP